MKNIVKLQSISRRRMIAITTLAVVIGFTMMACASSQPLENVPPYTYTGENPIYPAVFQAIANGNKSYWGNSTAYVMDANDITINHVRVSDGLLLADFTLRISLVNNVVTYLFSDIRTRSPLGTDADWSRAERFMQSDRELIFTSYFNTEIPKVMESESLYATAKEAADKTLGRVPGAPSTPGTPSTSSTPSAAILNFTLPLQNPQNLLLYPAIGAAFTSIKGSVGANSANLGEIDCLGNEFIIEDCVAERRMMDMISYKIKIVYRDNQLIIDFINIEPIGSNIMFYSASEVENMPRFDTQKISDQLKTLTEQNLANTNAYNEAKKAFLANNYFLWRSFAPVTNILRDEFVNKLFMDGEIGLNARISDVRKNENAEFRNYTTEIRAIMYPDTSSTRSFASISLYTSDSSLSRLRQGENIMLSGKLVRINFTENPRRFIMTK